MGIKSIEEYSCDLCGYTTQEKNANQLFGRINITIADVNNSFTKHICENCIKKINNFVKTKENFKS